MYRVAICEDEAPVRESLHRMCGELLAELDVPNEITTFSSAEALETDLRLHHQPESVTIRTGAGSQFCPWTGCGMWRAGTTCWWPSWSRGSWFCACACRTWRPCCPATGSAGATTAIW